MRRAPPTRFPSSANMAASLTCFARQCLVATACGRNAQVRNYSAKRIAKRATDGPSQSDDRSARQQEVVRRDSSWQLVRMMRAGNIERFSFCLRRCGKYLVLQAACIREDDLGNTK